MHQQAILKPTNRFTFESKQAVRQTSRYMEQHWIHANRMVTMNTVQIGRLHAGLNENALVIAISSNQQKSCK